MCLTVDTRDVDPEGDETVWHDGKVGDALLKSSGREMFTVPPYIKCT